MDVCSKFGENLKQARKKKGMTQEELAKEVGVSKQVISAYEKQDRFPTLDNAAKIASTLSVSLDHLCGISTASTENGENNDPEYISAADAINGISRICRYLDCSCDIEEMELIEPDEFGDYDPGTGEWKEYVQDTTRVAALYIRDNYVTEFVSNWIKMKKLCNDGIITKDLLETWYSGEISKYSMHGPIANTDDCDMPRFMCTKKVGYDLFGVDLKDDHYIW